MGFTPDSNILSLRLTDICNEGKLETDEVRLERVFGIENWAKKLGVNQLRNNVKTLPQTNPIKFPSLPLQKVPEEGYYVEELSDLFYVSKKGGEKLPQCPKPSQNRPKDQN